MKLTVRSVFKMVNYACFLALVTYGMDCVYKRTMESCTQNLTHYNFSTIFGNLNCSTNLCDIPGTRWGLGKLLPRNATTKQYDFLVWPTSVSDSTWTPTLLGFEFIGFSFCFIAYIFFFAYPRGLHDGVKIASRKETNKRSGSMDLQTAHDWLLVLGTRLQEASWRLTGYNRNCYTWSKVPLPLEPVKLKIKNRK